MKINKSFLCGFALGAVVVAVITYLCNIKHDMNDMEQLIDDCIDDDDYGDDFLVDEEDLFPSEK